MIMMTEHEAQRKLCPLVLGRFCLTYQCMIWIQCEEPESWRMAREAEIPLKPAEKWGRCGLVKE